MLLALAFTALRPPPTHGPFGRDFEAYYAAGATWNAGGDPWSRDVWRIERTIEGVDRGDELLPFAGPAFVLPMFSALARLPFAIAMRVWTGIVVLAFVAVVLATLALRRERRPIALLAAALFALVSGATVSDIALGQAAMLSAAGTACALAALARGSPWGGALAMLAAGIQPNLSLALVARLRDRAASTAAAIACAVYAAVTLTAGGGVRGLATYVHRLAEHGRAERFDAIQYSAASIAAGLGFTDASAVAAGAIVAALAIAATVAAIVFARLNAADGTLLAIAAVPLAVPFFHEHDFAIVLIALIVAALRSRGTTRTFAGVAAALVAVDWFGLAQRPVAAPQILALGAAAAVAFAALGRGVRATLPDAAPAVTLVVLACAAVPLARAHPAPTWPDGLPAAYRAPAGATAAGVWADEQRAAGVDRRDPVWSALRALPLVGCVVLGIALVRGAREDSERERAAG